MNLDTYEKRILNLIQNESDPDFMFRIVVRAEKPNVLYPDAAYEYATSAPPSVGPRSIADRSRPLSCDRPVRKEIEGAFDGASGILRFFFYFPLHV